MAQVRWHPMAQKRKYNEGCAVAHALDLVGERWALLIVRELLLGPKRFTDLRAGLPAVSPDVLAQRLRELTEAGVVQQRTLPPPAAAQVYELTDRGAELEPVVIALGRWGSRSASLNPAADSSTDSLALSLRALFNPQAAQGFSATLELRLGDIAYRIAIADCELQVGRGEAVAPAATLITDRTTLAGLLYGGQPLDDALQTGAAKITGQTDIAVRFLGLFPLPAASGTH